MGRGNSYHNQPRPALRLKLKNETEKLRLSRSKLLLPLRLLVFLRQLLLRRLRNGEESCFWIDAVFPFRSSVSGFTGRGCLWWTLPLPIWHQNGYQSLRTPRGALGCTQGLVALPTSLCVHPGAPRTPRRFLSKTRRTDRRVRGAPGCTQRLVALPLLAYTFLVPDGEGQLPPQTTATREA